MKKESAKNILEREINILEANHFEEIKGLKEQVHTIYDSLQPINLIKNTFKDATESPEIKGGLSKAAIGLASGYLVKNILFRPSYNPLNKLAGIAIQAFVTNLAAKNSDKIKESSMGIFRRLKSLIIPKKKELPQIDKELRSYLKQNI